MKKFYVFVKNIAQFLQFHEICIEMLIFSSLKQKTNDINTFGNNLKNNLFIS